MLCSTRNVYAGCRGDMLESRIDIACWRCLLARYIFFIRMGWTCSAFATLMDFVSLAALSAQHWQGGGILNLLQSKA